MNRRDLFTLDHPIAKKKHQDFSNTDRTSTGLNAYTGPWTLAEVKHLMRRALFGAPKIDADYFVNAGMANAVAELLTPLPAPPPPLYTFTSQYNDPNVPFGQTWVMAPSDQN